MQFTLRGTTFDMDREDVVRAVQRQEPEAVTIHAVNIGGKLYPVKQALGAALEGSGFARIDFTSADARRILRRLGFRLYHEAAPPARGRLRR